MKPETLKEKLNQLTQRIKCFITTGQAQPADRIASFRRRLEVVKEKVHKLPEEQKLAAFHVMWTDLEEVLFRYEQVASRLADSSSGEELSTFALLDDRLADEQEHQYQSRFM